MEALGFARSCGWVGPARAAVLLMLWVRYGPCLSIGSNFSVGMAPLLMLRVRYGLCLSISSNFGVDMAPMLVLWVRYGLCLGISSNSGVGMASTKIIRGWRISGIISSKGLGSRQAALLVL